MSAANSVFPGATGPEQPADQGLDPALAAAGELARQAAAEEAGAEYVGAHVGVQPEPSGAATHLFDSQLPGYRGWRWAVTVADAGSDTEVTVSEVVLLPGPDALVAPAWVPWQQRVRAGDLGVGDLMPPAQDDPRLAAAYLQSDDPEVEEVAMELGLGRVHVLSRLGRLEAAERWQEGDFGPGSEMARSAPEHCGNCGFYLRLAGSLRAAFGVCGNEISPADGRVVHAEYGCGAHSEIELALGSPVPVADLVYDDTVLDMEPVDTTEPPAPAPEADSAVVAEPDTADVEPEAEPEPEVAEVEPEPAAVAEPETALAEPDAVVAEPEEALAEPELAAPPEAEPEMVASEPVVEADQPEVVAEPEAVVAEREAVSFAEPEESSAEPTAQPDVAVVESAEALTEPEAAVVAEPAVLAEPVAAPDAVAEPEETVAEPEVVVPAATALAEPEVAADEPEVVAEPEVAVVEPEAAAVMEPEATLDEPETAPVVDPITDPITEPIVLPWLTAQPEVADKPEAEGQF